MLQPRLCLCFLGTFDNLAYKKLLKDVCGGCQVEEQTTTQFNDFATLALAPTVFCAARWFLLAVFIKLHALGATQMASSTFCLWAGMGNPGTVYFPGEFMADGQCPEMGRPILGKWIAARDASGKQTTMCAEYECPE
ncbi:hypothetical protein AK812_SmicGene11453 [Symbiodinium microadriaticum]|uniref:Uncharacterized protein n=1 Tax=Symbiodinium microadriaticum TaxID=2951 RepID=A0A1Q9ED69_SYMMI|nr:hypothetical protein AK812_SmicGene11453 [Symbiodinium microadriaticum]